MWITNYKKILPLLNSGDLILFSGQTGFSSLIKLFTVTKWSHVAMIYCAEDRLLCWESDIGIKRSAGSVEIQQSGVGMVEFEERVQNYEGEIAIRHISNLTKEDQQQNHRILTEFSKEVKDRPFEKSTLELIRAVYDGPFGKNIENLSRIFCSELVAAAYQRIGLLPSPPLGLASNEYTPADFGRNNFSLLKGKLTDCMLVKSKQEKISNIPMVKEREEMQ